MGKGLGDNYREGTGRGAAGPGGPALLICSRYADSRIPTVCRLRLKKKRGKKKTILGTLLRAVMGVSQMLGDSGRLQIYSLVIADDAIQRAGSWQMGGIREERKPWSREKLGSGITAPGRRINHGGARRGDLGCTVVCDGDGRTGTVPSPTSTTQSHHFNFNPRGEIRCVSCVILISTMSRHLPVSFYTRYTWCNSCIHLPR